MNIFAYFKKKVIDLRRYRWALQKESQLIRWSVERFKAKPITNTNDAAKIEHLTFVCEEFFHADLRGFGGFGKTVKNIAEHFNVGSKKQLFTVALALPQPTSLIKEVCVKSYHETDVILRPHEDSLCFDTFSQYANHIQKRAKNVFITIDWYPSYSTPTYALSSLPLLIWIHDPRDREEWEKIAGVADEVKFRGLSSRAELINLAHEKKVSIHKLFSIQRKLPRKIIFATTARTLVGRAERTYGIKKIFAYWLPNPIPMPALENIQFTERPTLVYLGRLDAIKRPWIAFEMAKRHKDIDIVIAGQAHNIELMSPWLQRYRHLSNLKFVGHVDGDSKDALLRTCWGILNTSVHEAEPVSFLEAFSYGKCVISCHDPDYAVTKFGYFTGEVLGDGLEEVDLIRFDAQVRNLVENPKVRIEKGQLARAEMLKNHTFESFHNHLQIIFKSEGI